MGTDNNKNGTMKFRVGSLEKTVEALREDVVNMKMAIATTEIEIKNIHTDIREATGSMQNICHEIKEFKDNNAKTIASNSYALGKITGKLWIMWAVLFLILSGIVTLGFRQQKTIKNNNTTQEGR